VTSDEETSVFVLEFLMNLKMVVCSVSFTTNLRELVAYMELHSNPVHQSVRCMGFCSYIIICRVAYKLKKN